jgi:hypothetical protein
MLITRAELVYHRAHDPDRDILKLAVTPRAGSHMETLAFYFPVVLRDEAVMRIHWGEMILPVRLKAPYRPQ